MSEEFKIEIVNPEKSFLLKEDVTEVVVPAFEGEMGILKDHISIISFLKPGVIKISAQSGEHAMRCRLMKLWSTLRRGTVMMTCWLPLV